ncbi:hypothetical protein CU560_18515 [Serratia ureilytica]|nr:hypothetical protein CU560_18515 [Serratia ureilytica]
MDNKLSELSKPVMYVVRTLGGSVASVKSHSYTAPKGFTSEPLYSQEYVSALLAELEAKDKRIVALERINKAQEDHINQQQDRIESLEKKNGDLGHGLQAAEKRIAGLVARLATPVRLLGEMLVHDWEHRVERQAAFEHRKIAWDARLAEDKKAILAAGFTFTVEGDSE